MPVPPSSDSVAPNSLKHTVTNEGLSTVARTLARSVAHSLSPVVFLTEKNLTGDLNSSGLS